MRSRPLLLCLFLPLAIVTWIPTIAHADSDYGGGPDEHQDEATPNHRPPDNRPMSTTLSATAAAEATNARVIGTPIEDFRYDDLVLEGYAKDVCAGRLLTGSNWTFWEIVDRFGGTAGTMYYCRERWDVFNDPDCNGTVINPVSNPNFFSECWSNHARGRAIDIMVGRVGSGYNHNRGVSIVNWLLARDAAGNVNANARALGIQQILFEDRCWNSAGDRGIGTWATMRSCDVGHHDHVHIDLTVRGANGTVSYWGATPVIEPKADTQVLWDRNAAWRQAVSWWNLQATDEEGLSLPPGYDRAIVGDWDSDGTQDEIFLWDVDTGNWILQNWTKGDSLNARIGTFTRGYDEIVPGDWDSDGRVDDMLIWDRDAGAYVVQSWSAYAPTYRSSGTWTRGYDRLYAGDLDGDGRVDETLLWNRATGRWVVHSWQGFRPTYRSHGDWSRGYEEVIIGDWSAGGDLDEALIWDRNGGRWVLQSWVAFRPIYRRSGAWSSAFDIAAPGDYDTDGRIDDIYLYDDATGRWSLQSFHRNVPSNRTSGTGLAGYDVVSVGSFMD